MTNRDRIRKTLSFEKPDRLPVIEWAPWWDKTIERWHGEGLPAQLTDITDIAVYFGLDPGRQMGAPILTSGFNEYGKIFTHSDYERCRHFYFKGLDSETKENIAFWKEKQEKGEVFIWITLAGFFWHPRTLFGIEKHLYAFYDQPDLMKRMNRDLVEGQLKIIEEFCSICVPDFMTFAEDMSYNIGAMISKNLFDEFIAPYYIQVVPVLEKHGITPIVDSDGYITNLIGWFREVGIRGFLPLERQAGVDIARLKKEHPDTRFIGGYDKMVMSKTEKEMRAEFERLLPVMRQGGYIPSVDHQTPPGVSLSNYKIYVSLLKEYCVKACR